MLIILIPKKLQIHYWQLKHWCVSDESTIMEPLSATLTVVSTPRDSRHAPSTSTSRHSPSAFTLSINSLHNMQWLLTLHYSPHVFFFFKKVRSTPTLCIRIHHIALASNWNREGGVYSELATGRSARDTSQNSTFPSDRKCSTILCLVAILSLRRTGPDTLQHRAIMRFMCCI